MDFKTLNLALPGVQVAEMLGLQCATRNRTIWRGRCPFHASHSLRSRVFQINLERGVYLCFKCHAKGDLIDLTARVTRVSMFVAAERLANEFGFR